MKFDRSLSFALFVVAILLILVIPLDEVSARAGGGGGGGGGGIGGGGGGGRVGIIAILLLPLFFIYSAIITYLVAKRNKESKSLLDQLAKKDSSWSLDKIRSQIKISFFKIQEAWMERDQDIAKDFMSEKLYQKHKAQTDEMILKNRKNILEGIKLRELKIVEVADYEDDSRDRIWVYIKGSMIDYAIDTTNNKVVSGDPNEAEHFCELWKYVRRNNNWVLDEIDQKVDISDLKGFESFSEAPK